MLAWGIFGGEYAERRLIDAEYPMPAPEAEALADDE